MSANTTTELVIGNTVLELAKGDTVRVTTTGGEVVEGAFVSLTARGIRVHVTALETSRYVTRKMSVVADVELLPTGDDEVPASTPTASGETTVFSDPAQTEVEAPAAAAPPVLSDEDVDAEFAALMAQSTEFGHGATQVENLVEGAAAAHAAAPAPEAADYDTDPMVDGRRLSEMKFAEVMTLAKKYKTPGRGVARIQALRDGVAKAISLEVGRLASS